MWQHLMMAGSFIAVQGFWGCGGGPGGSSDSPRGTDNSNRGCWFKTNSNPTFGNTCWQFSGNYATAAGKCHDQGGTTVQSCPKENLACIVSVEKNKELYVFAPDDKGYCNRQ